MILTFNVEDEDESGDVELTASTTPTNGVGSFLYGRIANDQADECAEAVLEPKLVIIDALCLDNLDFDDTVDPVDGRAAFLCTGEGTVQFTLEQGGTTLDDPSFVASCVEPVSTPVDLTLEVTSDIEDEVSVCPSIVRIEARVLDVDDDPLPDGIIINFVARGATLTSGFAVTLDGFAETTIQVPADAPPEIEVLASATVQGVSLQERLDIDVLCGQAFEPSNVTFILSTEPVECGTAAFLGGRVVDDDGATVADGTAVELIATHGTLEPEQTTTSGGMFTVKYTAPASAVNDTVTVAVKGFFESTDVTVSCAGVLPGDDGAAPGGALTGGGAAGGAAGAGGGTAGAGGAISPPSTGAGSVISPPNTGDGGLRSPDAGATPIALIAAGLIALAAISRRFARD